jgi:hypothetical protein
MCDEHQQFPTFSSPFMRRQPVLQLCTMIAISAASFPAAALVGGAARPPDSIDGTLVVITGMPRGTVCSGAMLDRDLVLTAAHCIWPGTTYRVSEFDLRRSSSAMATRRIMVHPQFSRASYERNQATADIALIKLAAPLSSIVRPALLSANETLSAGDHFIVAGFGVSNRTSIQDGIGTRRAAKLIAVGHPSSLQLRLADPAGGAGARPGLGACEGDSGAPVFAGGDGPPAIVGVVSWSTGPALTAGCGGLTGVTPLARYRAWIVDTAARFGSTLVPPI